MKDGRKLRSRRRWLSGHPLSIVSDECRLQEGQIKSRVSVKLHLINTTYTTDTTDLSLACPLSPCVRWWPDQLRTYCPQHLDVSAWMRFSPTNHSAAFFAWPGLPTSDPQRMTPLFSQDIRHYTKVHNCWKLSSNYRSSVIWNLMATGNINKIESVQRRFTIRLTGLGKLCYESRLTVLKTESLERRRLRADLIMCYKILNGIVIFWSW